MRQSGIKRRLETAVVGGGLAGLAAATVLAENGARVTLYEREDILGGRAAAWNDELKDGTSFQMERGFHAFFRQYYNLRALMRRVDPELSCLTPMTDYPVLGEDGAKASFRALPKRAPLNIAELVRRTDSLGLQALLQIDRKAAAAMLAFGPHTYERYDHMSAREYLDSLSFPEEARRMLFDVFSHSFFSREENLSAAELLMQFHFYFMGNPEGLVFDTMNVPFSRGLFNPLGHYLRSLDVNVQTGAAVERVERAPGHANGYDVHVGSRSTRFDGVVLGLSVNPLRELVARSKTLGNETWRSDVDALEVTWPFVVWRLWLDRPVAAHRAPFAGTAGVGLLDNISVYEKLEDESRAQAEQRGGSVVELHAYAVDPVHHEEAIKTNLLAGLHELYPETRDATILEERYLCRWDCPAFAPGSHARRPSVITPERMVTLAGDFVRIEQPSALMERAVTTGFIAANSLLGHRAQEIESVPRSGVLSALKL